VADASALHTVDGIVDFLECGSPVPLWPVCCEPSKILSRPWSRTAEPPRARKPERPPAGQGGPGICRAVL